MVCVNDTATCPRLTLVSRLPRVCTAAKGSTLRTCTRHESSRLDVKQHVHKRGGVCILSHGIPFCEEACSDTHKCRLSTSPGQHYRSGCWLRSEVCCQAIIARGELRWTLQGGALPGPYPTLASHASSEPTSSGQALTLRQTAQDTPHYVSP